VKKNILIVGGTSGLGLELAKFYSVDGHQVCITGRNNPSLQHCSFVRLSITDDTDQLIAAVDSVIDKFENINTLVYAAGFLQRGHIDTLTDAALQEMVNVGLLTPMLLVQRLKNLLDTPLKIIFITSSSQYTPRALEPAYCAVKAGLAMLGASLARDKAIGKVLVAAPSGIASPFWRESDEDTSTMLDCKWVADQIVELSSGRFKYKYAKMLRNPARVEIQDCLDNDLNSMTLRDSGGHHAH